MLHGNTSTPVNLGGPPSARRLRHQKVNYQGKSDPSSVSLPLKCECVCHFDSIYLNVEISAINLFALFQINCLNASPLGILEISLYQNIFA